MRDAALNEDQQDYLLKTARQSIRQHLKTGAAPEVEVQDPRLNEKRGVFVTLKKDRQLRGCIGYPWPHKTLLKAVIESAAAAATQDYRFQTISLEELPAIHIEISVLSRPWKIEDVSEIEVGKHGIIVSKGPNKGLLLPQVPVEWDWDRETYLRHVCLKAGLEENDWKKGVRIEVFTAQVFSE